MKQNLKKLHRISFKNSMDFTLCLQKLSKQEKIGSSWSFKKMLCSYHQLVFFYFQQSFSNFLNQNEILSQNFEEFKTYYSERNFHNYGSLYVTNPKEENFFKCYDILEDSWVSFSLAYLVEEDLRIPLVLKLRNLRNEFETIDDLFYEIYKISEIDDSEIENQEKIKKAIPYFEDVARIFNQNILFLMEAFFFRNLLVRQCFSILSFSTFFYDYIILILSFDWELSFFSDDFQRALSTYERLYRRFFQN